MALLPTPTRTSIAPSLPSASSPFFLLPRTMYSRCRFIEVPFAEDQSRAPVKIPLSNEASRVRMWFLRAMPAAGNSAISISAFSLPLNLLFTSPPKINK